MGVGADGRAATQRGGSGEHPVAGDGLPHGDLVAGERQVGRRRPVGGGRPGGKWEGAMRDSVRELVDGSVVKKIQTCYLPPPLIMEHLPNVEHWPIVGRGTQNLMRVQ